MREIQVSLATVGAASLIAAGIFLGPCAPAFAQWRIYWAYEAYPAYPSNGYPGYPSYPAYPNYPESYVDPVAPPAFPPPPPYQGRPYAYGAPDEEIYGPAGHGPTYGG